MKDDSGKYQNIYADYCENIIPRLWKSLLIDNAVEPILQHEISLYHIIAKSPDDQSSLSRFYSQYESLILCSATNYGKSNKFSLHDNFFSTKQLDLSRYIDIKSAIVFKGGFKLAHFDVLKSCINSLSNHHKRNLLLIFIDYPTSHEKYFCKLLGLSHCICVKGINKNLKIRYHYCAYLLNRFRFLDSVTFWGTPFGMLFISKLIKKYYNNNSLLIRYLTVKHKFSFSARYVDRLVNGAPALKGYDYVNQSLESLHPNYYSYDILRNKNINQAAEDQALCSLRLLNKIKSQNTESIIVGVFARKEKVSFRFLSSLVKTISSLPYDIKNKIVIASCTSGSDIKLLTDAAGISAIDLHWGDFYFNYFNYIDLFLDTYPFGGGVLLAQALVRGIPSLVSTEDILSSPSSIHAIKSRGLPLIRLQKPEYIGCISDYLLHDTEKAYWIAFKKLVCNPEIMHNMSNASRSLGEASFLAQSKLQAEELALKYLNLG